MNHKITVMQLIGTLNIGGAQEVVRTLSEYLQSHNCQPIVCTFKDGPLRDEIESTGVVVEVLPPRRYSVVALPFFLIDMIRIWKALAKLIKKHKVDVIQTHILGSLDFLVLLLRYTTTLKVVIWTFHSSKFEVTEKKVPKHRWLLIPKRFGYRLLYRIGAFFVDGFVAVSDQTKAAMLDIIGPIEHKVTVICNGVDTQRYKQVVDKALVRNQLGLSATQYLISVVATLKKPKGHRYLIEALASIVARHPNVWAIFIGDGPLRDELCLQIDGLQLGDHILLLGNRTDVSKLLAASNLFVLPSLWEGLSMSLLEAMAVGLPVVASQVSGTVQLISTNESGILVPPGDVEQLKKAIEFMINEPMAAKKMGKTAQKTIEQGFSAQKQAAEHMALYLRKF